MRLFAVADCVAAVLDVDRSVRHHLDGLSVQDTVLLLCHHILDAGLHCLEVVADLLHLVGSLALSHFRHTCDHSRRVFCTTCEKSLGLQVVLHIVGSQFHITVSDGHVTIVIYHLLSACEIFDDGVPCCRECR